MIEVVELDPGAQTALAVAQRVASFLAGARRTLELALYDLHLGGESGALVTEALVGAAGRGVAVRLAYNVDREGPVPVPPPPQAVPDQIEALPVPTRGVPGIPDLMHHKYAVRDGEAVWTGSANWTDDSWTLQENVIAVVASPGVASAYRRDFEQLWETADVARSGDVEPVPVAVGTATVRAWFTPHRGEALSHRIASRLGRARRRVRICSPVITAGPILGTLAEIASDGRLDLAGAVDLTQIRDVLEQWRVNHNAAWKTPALCRVLEQGGFSGKPSTRWSPTSVHDFMHAKVTVADDTVFLGSYNLSHSGELNAENMLEIEDAALADRLAAFVDRVRARYPPAALPRGPSGPGGTPSA